MRYLIGFLIAIGLIVLVFVLILKSFSGGSTKSTTKPLVDYANTTTTVEMLIDGPINADQSHYQIQMTAGDELNQISLLQGYQGTAAKTISYAANPSSYGEFLRALDIAGYSKGDTSKTADNDPRGFCPTGERYTFEIISGGQTVENFWATSCGSQGTFQGNTNIVKNLFIAQMPDYQSIVNNTDVF